MTKALELLKKEDLIERLVQAEEKAETCQIEAAVYRQELRNCEELARDAKRTDNPQLLFGVMSKASIALKQKNNQEWAKAWQQVAAGNIKWLEATL